MFGFILLLLLTAVLLINYSPVQSYLAKKAADILSDRLKTKVEVGHVRIGLLNSLLVQEVYMQDQSNDTLLYAGEIQARITDWFIFKDKPVLHFLGLEDAYLHLRRDSAIWNYAFIEDAFSTPDTKKEKSAGKPFEFDLQKIELNNVRVHMDDAWIGEDMHYDLGDLSISANGIDFGKKQIDIDYISVKNSGVLINEYDGSRPPHLRPKHTGFDSTAFNPDMWGLDVSSLLLNGCYFRYTSSDRAPVPGVFDENHLDIKGINIDLDHISVTGDTVTGNLNNLTAVDRCGIAIKQMKCKVSVSPIASVCKDLYLETNNSILKDYYAMYYRHFPDFNNYIDSVIMVAHLKDAKVDKNDIMFFAPALEDFPDMRVTINGKGQGSVSNLTANGLSISDGNVELKGNLAMQGLPDIYTTLITYTEGEIITTGKGIMHYVPALRDNPAFAADSISYAAFNGMYEGYIENFRVNGVFKTNLGDAVTDIKMSIPDFNADSASYVGTIATSKLRLGTLLRQPMIGDITANEKISGYSFKPEIMQMKLDGTINEFMINRYRYHNIITEGVLARQQFDGHLLVDDPNLALDFNGRVNFSGREVRIDAVAHLLGSNFKALNFTSDSVTASADFDLNWTGSNIDNFRGYGKLFNIDLRRNAHRLDIDSIYVLSGGDSINRKLAVYSDAFTGHIDGNYRLSSLPASVQYYLSRYIPNYIKPPHKYAPGQVFDFTLKTASVDSIFAVTIPEIRGFNDASFSGSLNTVTGSLILNAEVPYASIDALEMHDISVQGLGDLSNIAVSTEVGFISIADSALKGAMSLTSTVGRDTISFTLATVSPDKESSASVYGQIVAAHDSLTLTTFPSQFYLSKAKWDVAGGGKIVYSDKFLSVRGVALSSGIQRITVSGNTFNKGTLTFNAHNIDIAQLGNIVGAAGYQADGRIDALLTVNDLFDKLMVSANLRATGVKLGNDTIGTIALIGYYDDSKKILGIDPQTGIYRDNASVVASGTFSLDSTVAKGIDGSIRFREARVAWASPFLTGLMSNLKGAVNGSIGLRGTVSKPLIDGTLNLTDAALRLDYMGCNYTIPSATVQVNNREISLGNVIINDASGNRATLSGYFSHNLFDRMRMHLKITTPKFEVMNLTHAENELFYGKLTASMDSFTIRGAFNNIRLNLHGGAPAAKSVIYIPASTGNYTGAYSYVTFKTYGETQEPAGRKVKDRISINLDANLNELAEIHIVMDPATNDEIVAKGKGNIQMDIPPNNDLRMTGVYTITEGVYTLTFQQLAIHRLFRLIPGSTIGFNGPFSETNLAVNATYTTKARLFDLLSTIDKNAISSNDNEMRDAQVPQFVNVLLHMNGPIYQSNLSFDIELDNNHSYSTFAGRKLQLINNDDRRKFDQVAALLLVGSFIPEEGPSGSSAISGTVNNVSQMISSSASAGLTKIVNKLLGNRNLNVAVKYTNYENSTNASWNQLKLGVTKNYLNDRLLVSLGSTSDWGKPATTNSTTNFNFAGDFRLQYILSGSSGLRLNAFSTSDYDIVLNRNIQRMGAGIGWRRSFDNLGEFFGGAAHMQRKQERQRLQDSVAAAAILQETKKKKSK